MPSRTHSSHHIRVSWSWRNIFFPCTNSHLFKHLVRRMVSTTLSFGVNLCQLLHPWRIQISDHSLINAFGLFVWIEQTDWIDILLSYIYLIFPIWANNSNKLSFPSGSGNVYKCKYYLLCFLLSLEPTIQFLSHRIVFLSCTRLVEGNFCMHS